jgi:hypothetical protein
MAEDEFTKKKDSGENLLTASLNSSIAADEVFLKLEREGIFEHIHDELSDERS